VPGFAVKLLYGEMATLVISGQRAVPRRALDGGYEFRHPDLGEALRSVLR
jgi:NAD dependent epimerase/dehydratase family enzyme